MKSVSNPSWTAASIFSTFSHVHDPVHVIGQYSVHTQRERERSYQQASVHKHTHPHPRGDSQSQIFRTYTDQQVSFLIKPQSATNLLINSQEKGMEHTARASSTLAVRVMSSFLAAVALLGGCLAAFAACLSGADAAGGRLTAAGWWASHFVVV